MSSGVGCLGIARYSVEYQSNVAITSDGRFPSVLSLIHYSLRALLVLLVRLHRNGRHHRHHRIEPSREAWGQSAVSIL